MLEGKLFVIDAEAIQDGGVQIANMNRILDDIISEIVGLAIHRSSFYSSSGHPFRETLGMVVSSIIGFRERALAIDSATEFPSPDNESVVKHTPLFQIGN